LADNPARLYGFPSDQGEIMHLRALLAISVVLCCNAAIAGLKEGYEALARQDYATAMIIVVLMVTSLGARYRANVG
jgi:hypothetical protein